MELCENIFETSSRCIKYMDDVDLSDYEILRKQDAQTCKVFDNLNDGTFDVTSGTISVEDDRTVTETIRNKSVTPMQGAFLGFTVLGSLAMLFYVSQLR